MEYLYVAMPLFAVGGAMLLCGLVGVVRENRR